MTTNRIDIADPTVSDDTMVTRQECADYVRTTVVNWDRLVASGVAPVRATPPGIRPRWRVGDIRAWIKNNTRTEGKEKAA